MYKICKRAVFLDRKARCFAPADPVSQTTMRTPVSEAMATIDKESPKHNSQEE